MTETTTEGRAFMKYNSSVRQVPEVRERRSLAASYNFCNVVNAKSVIASAHARVRKTRSRGMNLWLVWCTHCPRFTSFSNSSPMESASTAADNSDTWAKTRQTLGLVWKAKSHRTALDTSATPLSEQRRRNFVSTPLLYGQLPQATAPVLLTIKSAREPEENLSQVLIFYPTVTMTSQPGHICAQKRRIL